MGRREGEGAAGLEGGRRCLPGRMLQCLMEDWRLLIHCTSGMRAGPQLLSKAMC